MLTKQILEVCIGDPEFNESSFIVFKSDRNTVMNIASLLESATNVLYTEVTEKTEKEYNGYEGDMNEIAPKLG